MMPSPQMGLLRPHHPFTGHPGPDGQIGFPPNQMLRPMGPWDTGKVVINVFSFKLGYDLVYVYR